MMFFYKLRARSGSDRRQKEVRELLPRGELKKQVGESGVRRRRGTERLKAVRLQVLEQAVSKDVMLFTALVCYDRLQCPPEESLIATASAVDQFDEEVRTRHPHTPTFQLVRYCARQRKGLSVHAIR
jgi:hypothetical protein